ncbi:MAG: hypothetical protein AOA65_0031 [Candidatus Bathyarchaeota archaeon BA1]|nr:MAG: hypothetical protein AOA65_0031 [Candidatus Bathyarchaeota archaeon BA1]
MKPVFYSKTARDHVVFYRFPIEVLEDRIRAEEWVRIKENVYNVEFLRKGAVFTVRFAEYSDYILVLSLHKTMSRKKLKS